MGYYPHLIIWGAHTIHPPYLFHYVGRIPISIDRLLLRVTKEKGPDPFRFPALPCTDISSFPYVGEIILSEDKGIKLSFTHTRSNRQCMCDNRLPGKVVEDLVRDAL